MSEHKPAQAGKKNWLLGVKVSKKSGFIASLHAHSRQNDIWQLFVNHRRNLLFFLPLYLFMTGSKCESLEIVFGKLCLKYLFFISKSIWNSKFLCCKNSFCFVSIEKVIKFPSLLILPTALHWCRIRNQIAFMKLDELFRIFRNDWQERKYLLIV